MSVASNDGSHVLVTDTDNNQIREISASTGSTITTIPIPGGAASPRQVAWGPDGTIYIENTTDIEKWVPGSPGFVPIFNEVHGNAGGLAVDASGDVYAGVGHRLICIDASGTVYQLSQGDYPVAALALDSSGDLYVAVGGGQNYIDFRSPANHSYALGSTGDPTTGLSIWNDDTVVLSDPVRNALFQMPIFGEFSGQETGLAGIPYSGGFNGDGDPQSHELNDPQGLVMSSTGLVIADTGNARVRLLTLTGKGSSFPTSGPVGPPTTSAPPPEPDMNVDRLGPGELDGGGNPAERCACAQDQQTGSPVDTATGNFWHTVADLSVPDRGTPLMMSRTYNSNLASTDGPLGHGWSSNYQTDLTSDTYGDITWHEADGAQVVFAPQDDGSYSPEVPRVLAKLVENTNGSFVLTNRARQTYAFNADGQLTSESDLNGNKTTLSYDGSGNLTGVDGPAGRSLSVTTSNGRITSVADQAGHTAFYDYDAAGDLTSVTDPDGDTWTYGYDGNHLLTTMVDPNQQGATSPQPLTNAYNANGQVASQTDYAGRTTTFAYAGDNDSAAGGSTTITDPRGDVTVDDYTNGLLESQTRAAGTSNAETWSYAYDPTTFGRTSVTDPDGHTTSETYDADGNVTSSTDGLGRTTSMTYDSLDDPLTMTDPAGVTTTNTYDPDGNLLSIAMPIDASRTATTSYTYGDPGNPGLPTAVTDPNGHTTHFGYDSAGDLTSVTDADGDKTVRSYNLAGWLTSSVSARGEAAGANPAQYTTSDSYDADGRVLSVTSPLGEVTRFSYDADGNKIAAVDADGYTTSYSYDPDNELTATTRADGTVISTGYNPDGQTTSQTDAAGHVTRYAYNPLGELTSTTTADGEVTSDGYDAAGNRTSMADPNGHTVHYTYDAANELIGVTYTDGSAPNVSYGYDQDGRRTSMSDGTGTSHYAFNMAGWLTSYTNGAGATDVYGYDLDGNQTTFRYPSGFTVGRGYDPANREVWVNDGNGNPTNDFGYDPDGNLIEEIYGNGLIATTTYDRDDRISQVKDNLATVGQLASFTYTRNPVGQVATSSDQYSSLPAQTSTDTYTPIHQLASDSAGGYSYDQADNLTSIPGGTDLTQPQTFNGDDELTSDTPTVAGHATVATSYGYDPDGNRTTATTSSVTITNGYNGADQLASISEAGHATVAYGYNGDGLRMSKTVASQTNQFAYDITASIPEVISDGTSYYIYGPGGRAVEQINTTTNKITAYLSQDQLGSTRLLTSTSGLVIGAYKYSSYGKPGLVTGILQKMTTPIGYAGGYTDPETGLLYLINRYYDSATGQFLTRDPLAALTGNPYTYTGDDPLNFDDPSGMDSVGVTEGQVMIDASASAFAALSLMRYELIGEDTEDLAAGALAVASTALASYVEYVDHSILSGVATATTLAGDLAYLGTFAQATVTIFARVEVAEEAQLTFDSDTGLVPIVGEYYDVAWVAAIDNSTAVYAGYAALALSIASLTVDLHTLISELNAQSAQSADC